MPRALLVLALCLTALTAAPIARADDEEPEEKSGAQVLGSLRLRLLGPAVNSGRIVDLAVNPRRPAEFYVAAASGGVWKTTNAGTTFKPIFDGQGSYSIGCLALDPTDPRVLWVGTGENNSQRSVSYGDGVYKSVDGGLSFQNVGLKTSEHIGMIRVDPRDPDVVYVAAQGPLWAPGGERGLYKTVDGGKGWTRILDAGPDTGVSEVHFDPRDPDVLYAVTYQRRRHVWTLIDGGPECGVHKSVDGGATWRKIHRGLPGVVLGRIGLAVSPVDGDVVYAIVEAAEGKSGFFRSENGGETWEKRSGYATTSPQYYEEIFADPTDVDRVYVMDTVLHVTEDGGRTIKAMPREHKHVDNHALWIDPSDPDHLRVGCDGGLYETWDRGRAWSFFANLPLTQFYRICADMDYPFYNVYGGTQDNNTLGGPSRTVRASGIVNSDWYVTVGGDGYETQVDPTDPDIVYSQYQYGGLVRFDRASGESLDIQPQPAAGEAALRWNWDSPLLLSPHSPTRLYFAANRLFRTDDRGDSWTAVSPDLTRQLDRNQLKVMGRIWSVDAVAKNNSTSFYGNIVSVEESPRVENLLYVGTDDGLVQVSADGGQAWTRIETVAGVPEMSYVSDLCASLHEDARVYAAFDNHKQGDFKPYLLRSDDRGASWQSVAGDLPERGSVYTVVEDHVDPDLLFAGTEFGAFVTTDGGAHWTKLSNGLPVIAVRDLEIQRREDDLVVGTFGRGIYVLDDYSPLRTLTPERLAEAAVLLPIRDAWQYVEARPLGGGEKGTQGAGFFTAANPPAGAVLTYYLKEKLQTARAERLERERKARADGQDVPYPDWDALRDEDRERDPFILLTIRDPDGAVVRRLTGPVGAGLHRVTWDLRLPPSTPAAPEGFDPDDEDEPSGAFVAPGTYTVALEQSIRGVIEPLGVPQSFRVTPLAGATLPAVDRAALLAFQRQAADLQRAVLGTVRVLGEAKSRLDHLRGAWKATPGAAPEILDRIRAVELGFLDLEVELSGDAAIASRSEPAPPGLRERIGRVVGAAHRSTSAPTRTHVEAYGIVAEALPGVLERLRALIEVDLHGIEQALEDVGAPWTPGRIPRWPR